MDSAATRVSVVPDASGHFGRFGGRFMPEALVAPLDELAAAWQDAMVDKGFRAEFDRMLREYAGVPSLLYDATRLSDREEAVSDETWKPQRPTQMLTFSACRRKN